MKQTTIIFIFFISLFTFAQKKVDLKPVDNKQAVRIVSGKQNDYYHLTKDNLIEFNIANYDKLYIYSREQINNKAFGYEILYNFDLNATKSYFISAKKRDYKSVFYDKTVQKNTSYYFKKEITIPKEAQTIKLKLISDNNDVSIKVVAIKNGKTTVIKAKTGKENTIITGKTYKYYKLNSKINTSIETNKEGELIVYTRKRLSNKSSNNYFFTYQIDNSEIKKIVISNVNKSKKSAYKSLKIKQTPSTYNKTVIKVGDVYQKVTFSSKFPVDARFVFKKTTKKDGWEEIESSSKSKIVPLIVKNKKTIKDYSRISYGKPFIFKINNTEEIKIFIRGEFKYDMHANNDYEIILKENNKIIHTYKLSCNRSNVMIYKYDDELIPGTLDKFSIKVPLGKHKYSISIKNKNKTALIKVVKKTNNSLTFTGNTK